MESIEEMSGTVTAGSPEARVRVLLPGVGEKELYELAELLETMIAADGEENAAAPGCDFLLIGFPVGDWNRELSPWTAPPVFGSEPFSGCAGATMERILSFLNEDREQNAALSPEYLIAGYSLAGLFSLYAVSVSDVFSGAAAVSPSVWFPGWPDWSASHPPRCGHVYLSLGDREEKTKNPVLRTVGDAIRREKELLDSLGIPSDLEWNPGNHFIDCNLRLARGIRVALRASDAFPCGKVMCLRRERANVRGIGSRTKETGALVGRGLVSRRGRGTDVQEMNLARHCTIGYRLSFEKVSASNNDL